MNVLAVVASPVPADAYRGKIRIGWGGSASHAEDVASIVEPLTAILRSVRERAHGERAGCRLYVL